MVFQNGFDESNEYNGKKKTDDALGKQISAMHK